VKISEDQDIEENTTVSGEPCGKLQCREINAEECVYLNEGDGTLHPRSFPRPAIPPRNTRGET